MFKTCFVLPCILFVSLALPAQTDPGSEPVVAQKDWLIESPDVPVRIYRNETEVILCNGLISRTIRINPNAATVGMKNLVSGE